MRNLISTLIFVALTSPALAGMPPKNMDRGNPSMSEKQVLATYKAAFPKRYAKLKLVPVPYGSAGRLCGCDATFGCVVGGNTGNTLVYSRDNRLLAWLQGRDYDKHMAANVLRHEFAHKFFNWPKSHPHAQP